MADGETQDEPLFVPENDVIDLDAEPEKMYLEASAIWVRKDKVEESIRDEYRKVLRKVVNVALPRTALRGRLEDYFIASAKATSGKLIYRHTHLWGKAMSEARGKAKEELDKAEEVAEIVKKWRSIDIGDAGRIEGRATTRYNAAIESCDQAKVLIKDLKVYLQGRS